MMTIQFQASVLFVRDIQASRRFYEELLGQEVLLDHGPNVGFKGGFAIWQVDHAFQMIFERPPKASKQLGSDNFELYFEAADLDSVWTRLSGGEAQIAHPMREQPWGQRVLRIYDPDGHVVEIGEPMPAVILRFLSQGLTAEEIAGRTSMPLEIVQQIVASTNPTQ
jgi:catechol 2,3-dioxygenase-like lactoylglutathione lyase family enzyme